MRCSSASVGSSGQIWPLAIDCLVQGSYFPCFVLLCSRVGNRQIIVMEEWYFERQKGRPRLDAVTGSMSVETRGNLVHPFGRRLLCEDSSWGQVTPSRWAANTSSPISLYCSFGFLCFRLIFVWTEWCKGPNRGTLGFKNFWEEKWKHVIATHSQVCFACILFSLSISLWCSLTISLWTQNTSTTTFLSR